ncbi:hypothetical protein [Donghicola sp. XS_ASV15]|uniref:hypothetical protein n=1 Tax=Donghicola sp. XS_ASV15 TaxID=3241295 RepID=UPI003519C27F
MEVSSSSSMMAAQIAATNKPELEQGDAPQKTPADRASDTISLSPAARARLDADAKNTP